tara:strand:- start:865 stop:1797 length:933 start_codon:yes stop_codon:yes gene_type:complete
MQKKLFFIISLLIFSEMFSGNLFAINGYENCPMVDGKIDASELVNIVPYSGTSRTCDAPVSNFILTINKLALCTSDPNDYILGNSTADPCYYLWNTAEGNEAISFGVEKGNEFSFPATLPPSGTYTAGYAEISATIPIYVELEFDEELMFGGNSAGTGWSIPSPSKFIGGGDRNMSMQDFLTGNLFGFTEAFSESQPSFNNYSFTYNSLSTTEFLNTLVSYTALSHNGNYRSVFLLNDSGRLASTYSDVSSLIIKDEFSTPITITDQTSTVTYKYSPDYAARITVVPTGLGGWFVTSILFGDTQFAMEFE